MASTRSSLKIQRAPWNRCTLHVQLPRRTNTPLRKTSVPRLPVYNRFNAWIFNRVPKLPRRKSRPTRLRGQSARVSFNEGPNSPNSVIFIRAAARSSSAGSKAVRAGPGSDCFICILHFSSGSRKVCAVFGLRAPREPENLPPRAARRQRLFMAAAPAFAYLAPSRSHLHLFVTKTPRMITVITIMTHKPPA